MRAITSTMPEKLQQYKAVRVGALCLPYTMLAVLAGCTFPWRTASGTGLAVDVSLCALTAAWMLGMRTLNRAWRESVPHRAVFVVVLIVLTFGLIARDSWFGFFEAVAFGYSLTLLRWPWPMAGAAGCAFLSATSETAGVNSLSAHLLLFFVTFLINLLMLGMLMWLLFEREEQFARHTRALAELSEANRRLEATIAENEGLHRQLVAQAREAGVRDERRRMAREIHDTLAQGLTGIVTQLQAAEQAASRAPGAPAAWQRHVDAATRLARESLTEARRSVDALRPEPLECGRLSEALAGVAERWSALYGVPAQVTTTGTARPIDPEAEFAMLRATQEALANVAKHAHATRVGVTISYMENEVAVDVRDDGVGFDPALLDHGFGLVAMRERIAALCGTLQVESEPGGGTAISACVPTTPTVTAASTVTPMPTAPTVPALARR